MKRIIIIGATSGIGKAVAQGFIERGWRVGVAGRRQELLTQIETDYPEQVVSQVIDVSLPESTDQLQQLIEKLGGMDLFFLASGVGSQNRALDVEIELRTLRTNCEGFTRSEEHTSELQSHYSISYAVFCLKKKNSLKALLFSV